MPQYPPGPKAVSAGDKPYCDFLWRKLLPYPVPKPPEDLQLGYSKLAQKGFEHRCVRWDSRAPSFANAPFLFGHSKCEHLVPAKNIAHDMKSGADGAHFFGTHPILMSTFDFSFQYKTVRKHIIPIVHINPFHHLHNSFPLMNCKKRPAPHFPTYAYFRISALQSQEC